MRLPDLAISLQGQSLLLRSQSAGIAVRVPPPAVAVLSFCAEPKTRQQALAALGPQLVQLFDGLSDAGILVDPDVADATPVFFQNFAGLDIHRRMLDDTVRVDAYAAAIERAVQPGMAVMDAGTGSGLLACLAAKAGARVVYGVDNSDLLDMAREIVTSNDLSHVVKLVRGDFARVELPEPVDLIVSETFGALALAEGSVPDLSAAVRAHLAPGGRVLPDAVSLHMAPVGNTQLFADSSRAFGTLHGLSFDVLRASALRRGRVATISPDDLLAPGQRLVHLPYPSDVAAAGDLSFRCTAGAFCGLAAWFDVHDQDDVMLSTAPEAPDTHWKQVYLPLEPMALEPGALLEVSASIEPATDDRRSLEVTVDWSVGARRGATRFKVR